MALNRAAKGYGSMLALTHALLIKSFFDHAIYNLLLPGSDWLRPRIHFGMEAIRPQHIAIGQVQALSFRYARRSSHDRVGVGRVGRAGHVHPKYRGFRRLLARSMERLSYRKAHAITTAHDMRSTWILKSKKSIDSSARSSRRLMPLASCRRMLLERNMQICCLGQRLHVRCYLISGRYP